MRLLALVNALASLAAIFIIGRSDFAQHYGYLGVVVAVIGLVLSARSQTQFGKFIAFWLIIPGVSATAGWQLQHLLA